eukprot:CAMPEP_0198320202 /NCGR_PEP_ID=MMETSP1450-20131203/9188_1 /TAXON_ID=753684 ORGANISM="Madagascaria erythrocladiodes, Strain CCMP3234" /NCGR_SAMPLE_ID=MMETSP1450 /ASSEMBLY_ACC=CAM_ASM_001115 /LENGTH=122 /DNA_ID=CAMNT_0044023651 /DNA_START=25 /DNA_END=389 /DNA_ORIENTATION=-
MAAKKEVVVSKDKAALGAAVAEYVAGCADVALAERGRFVVAVSGGSMPALLASVELRERMKGKWKNVHFVFVDERWVATTDDDSNERALRKALLECDDVDVDDENVHGISFTTTSSSGGGGG